jgi:hypothetical protein
MRTNAARRHNGHPWHCDDSEQTIVQESIQACIHPSMHPSKHASIHPSIPDLASKHASIQLRRAPSPMEQTSIYLSSFAELPRPWSKQSNNPPFIPDLSSFSQCRWFLLGPSKNQRHCEKCKLFLYRYIKRRSALRMIRFIFMCSSMD